jgi:hypothetical protein
MDTFFGMPQLNCFSAIKLPHFMRKAAVQHFGKLFATEAAPE